MLRNRVDTDTPILRGVNLVTPATRLTPGTFTSLQNWIPSKKFKIKKKRGVATFVGQGVTSVTTPHACGTNPSLGLEYECGYDCPLGQYAQVTYEYDAADTTNSGPAMRIKSDSTVTLFYGIAAIYKRVAATKIVLGFWNYQSLATIPTILDTYVVTLNDGDIVKIETDTVDPYTYLVKVNGATVITYTDAGHTIDVNAPCVGFATVTTVA